MTLQRYVAATKVDREPLCEPSSYATAAMVARWEEVVRLEEIADVAFASPEDVHAAVEQTRCIVLFHDTKGAAR